MPDESPLDRSLREAHRQRIAAQLPTLAWVVTGSTVLWCGLADFADAAAMRAALPAASALAILVWQGLLFAVTVALCRRDPTSPRVTVYAVTVCIAVGFVWIWVLTATATVVSMLMFSVLMLLTAAPLVLAWRLGAQLVFQGTLTVAWLVGLPIMPRHVPLTEILAALALGNLLAVAATQWAVQAFRTEVLARFAAFDFDRQIAASRDAYRSLAENAADFIWAIDLEGRWTYVNEALARRCGSSTIAMVGRPVTEVLTASAANPDARVLLARAAAGESVEPQEFEMRTGDGGTCWVEAVASLVRDARGTIVGVQGVSRDVTARRRAEDALRASERRFRSFADSLAAGVVIVQAGGIAYANDAVSNIMGFSRDELSGMQLWDLVHPDARATARARIMARLDGAQLGPHTEYPLATKSGDLRWVDVSVAMLELDGVPALYGTAFDVTERKLAEQALRASEARYRGLVESQRELVLRFDRNGCVTFANDAYCDTYGVRRDEAVGQPFWPVVHSDDVARVQEAMRAMQGAPFRATVESRSLTVDGWRWFEWEASAIRDTSGVVLEGQAAGRDVTERRRAQDDLRASLEQLRRSEETLRLLAQRQVAVREDERKRLSFDLHDDVCQEIVGVGILIESVLGRVGGQSEVVSELSRATRYLREVVDHLRLLARDLRPITLPDLGLEASLRSLAAGFSNDRTKVRAVLPTVIPRLEESVELTVYRITQEAMTNALRHAEAREVVVELSVVGDRLLLTVRDDGRGFDRGRSAPPRALGLASMEERALALAGRLTVTSRVGEGTTVGLECPLVARPSASAA